MICNVCQGTGLKNLHQIPESVMDLMSDIIEDVPKWITAQTEPNDVCVCDCCGNGDVWYGDPGQHYNRDDPIGRNGPYAYNGGLCKCH